MLKKLTETMGISGRENAVRELILKEITPYCTSVKTDSMGNLIACKKGKSGRSAYALLGGTEHEGGDGVLLSAHMDEVGFLITDITEDGYLKFDTVGGIDPSVLISERVVVNGLNGVISFKAVHLTTKEEREKPVKLKDLCIDIGANSKAEAEKYVTVGDYCGFDSEYIEYGAHKVKAKALDDRVGCCILMELLKQEWECDLTCLFTVQEEVGLRGAKTAIYGLKPDYAVVVEATTCNDMTGIEEGQRVTEQGKGAAISVLDSASRANAELVNLLVNTAQRCKAPYQLKASTRGGNDAGAIHLANGGIRTASISIPCRYIHSPVSVMDKRDYESCLAILTQFLSDMRAKPIEHGEAMAIGFIPGPEPAMSLTGVLKHLCNCFNVSGVEGSAGYIMSELESFADEIYTDDMRNVIAHFKGEGEPLMIECGIDNDGFMVTACSDLKKVRVAAVGSPKIADWVGKRVKFTTGASGIVKTDEEKAEKADDIYVEVDCGETHVGDFVVMPADFSIGTGAPKPVTAFANNLSACVPALCLIETAKHWKEQGNKKDAYFLFSAQKRLGARGARAAIGGICPKYLLTVNTRESEEKDKVGILVKEKNAVAHEQMRQALEQAAKAAEVSYALTVEKENRFAESLSLAGNGSVFGGLYIPMEHCENAQERILMKTVENAQKILLQIPKHL